METKRSWEQFKGQTRLPKFAIPKRYDLFLKPDLSACTFSGTVQVSLDIIEDTKFLVLNALEIVIQEVRFTDSNNQTYRPCDVVLEGDDEILVLVFNELLNVGEGVLWIEFSAALNQHLIGFYKCTYMDGGVKKNMAATQFEAVEARRCFPCWDEPALKATFKITLDVPSDLTALSNMPIADENLEGNIRTVYFEESPIMSTYLVAVVVGAFDYIEETTADGIKVRAYCPVGKSDKGKFALDVAVKSLDIFAKYFSTPFPLPKLDMVAIPEFAGGAMENHGLITYRENDLLYDELLSSAARKQRVEVHHARSILEVGDDISYNKGSAVIRMLQGYLGDRMFQKSLSSFIKRYAGKNAKTEDLWSILSEESGVQVNSMMEAWTKQKGYPVISVKFRDNILEFEQSQFLLSGSHDDRLWTVPITLSIGSYDRHKTLPLETRFGELDISELVRSSDENSSSFKEKNEDYCDEHLWVKVNIDQSGFYRVEYEDKLAARLRKAVEGNYLSEIDKFGILDDAYALCMACKQSLSLLLSLMDAYRKELDFVVLSKLIDVCYKVVQISDDAIPDLVNELKQFFMNLLLFSSEKSGWESISGESHLSALLRGEVLLALSTFGHDNTHKEAIRRFQAFVDDRNTPLLSADTKRAAYIAVMMNTSTTNRNGFESLLNVYKEANTVQEKELVLCSIASCPDPDIVLEVLNFMLSDEVRDQDAIYVLAGISSKGGEAAWRWLKDNWELISTKYGGDGMLMHHLIQRIVTLFCSNEKADEIEAFFESRKRPSFDMNLRQGIEQVRIKARWVENIRREQSLRDQIKHLASKK